MKGNFNVAEEKIEFMCKQRVANSNSPIVDIDRGLINQTIDWAKMFLK